MRFEPTAVEGAWRVVLEPIEDERGFFARSFCASEFEKRGLNATVAQCNVSFNKLKGTVRGMHYSVPPAAEAKLVRCIRGTIWDVIVDLREDSPSYLQQFSVELSAENRLALYVPVGVGHGFQTLTDDAEVFYQMSVAFQPESQRGVRYDDPAIGIDWPLPITAMSDKDANAPTLRQVES
jgi:dTDP-4-dehydrorhamnose 3,5-epimerase